MLNLSRRALLIAKRDYLVSVRSKSFLFGLIVFPVLFGGSLLGVAVMKAKPDLRDRHVALIDHTGKLADFVVQAAAGKSDAGGHRGHHLSVMPARAAIGFTHLTSRREDRLEPGPRG